MFAWQNATNMKANKTTSRIATAYVLFSATNIFSVSAMAFFSPQAVMDLVSTNLPNTDAISSIRGVYGGVGLCIVIGLLHTLRRSLAQSLSFLLLFWGLYATSRLVTLLADGPLGNFGWRWLAIEAFLAVAAFALRYRLGRQQAATPAFS